MTWLARDPSWLRLPVMLVWDNWIALSTSRRRVTPSFGSPMNSRTKLEKLRSKSALSLTNNSVIELNCRRPISACCPWPLCYKTKLRIVIIYGGAVLPQVFRIDRVHISNITITSYHISISEVITHWMSITNYIQIVWRPIIISVKVMIAIFKSINASKLDNNENCLGRTTVGKVLTFQKSCMYVYLIEKNV